VCVCVWPLCKVYIERSLRAKCSQCFFGRSLPSGVIYGNWKWKIAENGNEKGSRKLTLPKLAHPLQMLHPLPVKILASTVFGLMNDDWWLHFHCLMNNWVLVRCFNSQSLLLTTEALTEPGKVSKTETLERKKFLTTDTNNWTRKSTTELELIALILYISEDRLVLHGFYTVGWATQPIKIATEMTYCVSRPTRHFGERFSQAT